ncbi:MAG: hypothetical protein QOF51_2145 [Chloroflexota bacterium]|jgi:DNA-binding transcriptional LysR family regulator|nr:hypothetical protein [Chloroflexota bacterium]
MIEEPNLYQLRILVAVVELGGVGRAAGSMHLSQPAVSAQLRHLRAFAGRPVLVRDGRRLVLTDAGQALYRYAKETLGATEALRRTFVDLAQGETDHFLIGASPTYATYILPSILSEFSLSHQTARLTLSLVASREIVDRVRENGMDLGVVPRSWIPEDLTNELLVADLGHEEWLVIEAAHAPFSHGEPLTREELAAIPFVAAHGRDAFTSGVDPSPFGAHAKKAPVEFGSWEAIKEAVRAGIGVAAVPHSIVHRELMLGEVRALDIETPRPASTIALICSPQRRRAPITQVLDELLHYVRQRVSLALGQE